MISDQLDGHVPSKNIFESKNKAIGKAQLEKGCTDDYRVEGKGIEMYLVNVFLKGN